MEQTQNQSQEAPSQPRSGRMVYGLDGQEPVNERDYARQELTEVGDMRGQTSDAMQRVLDRSAPGGELEAQQNSDAVYWKQKYEETQQQYAQVAQYGNIIKAMEGDQRLVDVMQRAIAGEVDALQRKDPVDFDDVFEDDGPKGPAPDGSSRNTTEEQRIAAAREQGIREARIQMEMQQAVREFVEQGASTAEQHAFEEFLVNPSGITAKDMLTLYRARAGSAQAPPQQAGKPKDRPIAPPPLATASGGTDRPTSDRYAETAQDDGVNFYPGDPNTL